MKIRPDIYERLKESAGWVEENSNRLDVSLNDYLKAPSKTTAERLALVAVNGMVVYDTTLNLFYKYEDGAWGAFGGGASWGGIIGTLSAQTDLQDALDAKTTASAVATQITSALTGYATETWVNAQGFITSLAGYATQAWVNSQGFITNVITSLGYTPENAANKENTTLDTSTTKYPTTNLVKTNIDLKVTANAGITGATKTKVTYDSKGLVTSGDDATTADISDSTDKRYVTDAQLLNIANVPLVNTTANTVSGTGTETVLCSITIPANTFSVGDGFNVITVLSKSAQTASDTWVVKVYLNDTNNLTTPNQLSTSGSLAATIRTFGSSRGSYVMTTATNVTCALTTSAFADDLAGGSANAYDTAITIPNITSTMYLLVTAQHNGAVNSDTITHRKTILTRHKV